MWNLQDLLAGTTNFSVPVSSTIGQPNLSILPPRYETAGAVTTDISLPVQFNPPFGITLPGETPSEIHLHALSNAIVRFQPATPNSGDRLILQLPALSTVSITQVPWWQRWVEARAIPDVIIYENIDRAELENRLRLAPFVPATDEFPIYPVSIFSEADKRSFLQQFFLGTDGYVLAANAGDFLAIPSPIESSPDPNQVARQVIFKARYQDHSDINPQPMNPLELLYLVFGNDSNDALNHPFLLAINDAGGQQTEQPETFRMALRPPLRTWKRVEWEADQEINNHVADWRPRGRLGPDRFYNSHRRGTNVFNESTYQGFNKCNLFTWDICLRAGFRVCVHPPSNTRWHYIDANSTANLAHNRHGTTDRNGLRGRNDDAGVTWGWQIENYLRSRDAADRQQALIDLMQVEGRCLILAGARPQKFAKRRMPNGQRGIFSCLNVVNNGNLRNKGIGHIVILKDVLAPPVLRNQAGSGWQQIHIQTMEASGGGAINRSYDARLNGSAGAAAGSTGFIRLHVIELHPGRDPDTLQGLRDLNVRNSNRNLLQTETERALIKRLTHNPDGTPRNDNRCCRDDQDPLVRNRNGSEIDCP